MIYTVNVDVNDKRNIKVRCNANSPEEAKEIAGRTINNFWAKNGHYNIDEFDLTSKADKKEWKKDNDLDYYDYWREVNP